MRILALSAILLLQGCYYLHLTQGQMELLSKREPIERVLDDPDTPDELRARLELAGEMRRFAVDELGLPDNDSYTSYADLGRPHAMWSVTVTEEFSLDPLRWCFPFAGCVSYRGYFDRDAAERFAARHRARGRDAYIGAVPAYSTLGWFRDPLLNTMLGEHEYELAALLFHELAHQRFYAKNDTAFSEAFATVVEREGVRRWLTARGEDDALREYERRRERVDGFAHAADAARAELRALYASDFPEADMRTRKAEVLDGLRARFGIERALDNAWLAAFATYNERVPELEALLAGVDGNLEAFYRAVAE